MKRLLFLLLCATTLSLMLPSEATAQCIYEFTDSLGSYRVEFTPHTKADDVYQKSSTAVKDSCNQEQTSKPTHWRHNLRVGFSSVGIISSNFLISSLQMNYKGSSPSASNSLAHSRFYQGPTYLFSGVTLEYSNNLKPWLAIGVKGSFAARWSDTRHVYTNEVVCRKSSYAIGLICNLRFDYLRRNIVRLYSSVGLGIAVRIAPDNNTVTPMIDATYIGITLGRSLYGFAEFGTGISGMLRAGIGYRF